MCSCVPVLTEVRHGDTGLVVEVSARHAVGQRTDLAHETDSFHHILWKLCDGEKILKLALDTGLEPFHLHIINPIPFLGDEIKDVVVHLPVGIENR